MDIKCFSVYVSIEYAIDEQKKYFGLTIAQIKGFNKHSCGKLKKNGIVKLFIRGRGLYVGVVVEEKDIKQEAKHRETIRREFGRKKKYLMKETSISAFENLEQNRISISNGLINLELLKIFFGAGVFLESNLLIYQASLEIWARKKYLN